MGTWGYGPWDSDSAYDYVARLFERANEPIQKVLKLKSVHARRYYYCEARAAIDATLAICKVGRLAKITTLHNANEVLASILSDSAWLADWKSEPEVRRQLQRKRYRIIRLIRKHNEARARLKTVLKKRKSPIPTKDDPPESNRGLYDWKKRKKKSSG